MLTHPLRHHPRLISRCYSHAAVLKTPQPQPQPQSQKCIRTQLRELFRETAQPVAVVTSLMAPGDTYYATPSGSKQTSPKAIFHGATLSSFTSIAMDPVPLVTFALRLPSRMATTLNALVNDPSQRHSTAHLVINILASTQAEHALTFSRPDLNPNPFYNPDLMFTLTQEGLPAFDGSLGSVSCRLIGPGLPLHDLEFLAPEDEGGGGPGFWQGRSGNGGFKRPVELKEGAAASELFIAQVTRIESLGWQNTQEGGETRQRMLPLLYHRKRFTTCSPPEESSS